MVIGSRANWGRSRSFALAAEADSQVKLSLILIGSALQDEFGSTMDDVTSDGFHDFVKLPTSTVYDEHYIQAVVTAEALFGLAEIFHHTSPDYVITIADRFETMSTAIAASYSNIKLVHIQGGEVSGNIDDKVRNAISMLADIHFPCSSMAYDRLCELVGNSENVFNFGCPAMDTIFSLNEDFQCKFLKEKLIGEFCMFSNPPNTENILESIKCYEKVGEIIKTQLHIQFLIIRPNIDAGNSILRTYLDVLEQIPNTILKNGLSPHDYGLALKKASILVGNSSSFLRESTLLGKPALIVGGRQRGRDSFDNIKYVPDDFIHESFQTNYGKSYEPQYVYGSGKSGIKILQKLKEYGVK